MNRFTHGIMVINPAELDEDDNYKIVHFTGYWSKPTDEDADKLREELRVDPEFEYRDIIDSLIMYPATEDVVKFYGDAAEADGLFDYNFGSN